MSNNLRKKGPGRPPKADEIKMIERMDAIAAPEKIWQLLFDRCKDGDTQAIKTWLAYRYGQPRQMIETAIQREYSKNCVKFTNWINLYT